MEVSKALSDFAELEGTQEMGNASPVLQSPEKEMTPSYEGIQN